ncbi:MAG: hypothetical protein ACFFAU_18720 [Candidatus Hodarchaeota archaeon]
MRRSQIIRLALIGTIIILALFLGSERIRSVQETAWSQTYGGNDHDYAFALIQTLDGGFALMGYTISFGAGEDDIWLVKTDANGVAQWNQTYGGDDDEKAYSIIQTADGGFALAGETNSFGAGSYNMWLVKTNANGVAQWNQTYGGNDYKFAYALIQTPDRGFALAGKTSSFGVAYSDMWLLKTDANGVAQWNQTYGGIRDELATALLQTADGGFTLVGKTSSFGAGSYDMWLVKTDANGVAQWNQTYGGNSYDSASALIQTPDGGLALAGYTFSFGAGEDDMWLLKTDANGVVQWNQTYGGNDSDSARALVQTLDGGFALAGSTFSFGAGRSDMWLVKTNANGVAQWNQTYGGNDSDSARALVKTLGGGFALAGSTYSFGAGRNDMWLVKTKAQTIQDIPPIIIFGSFLILGITTLLVITLYNLSKYRS